MHMSGIFLLWALEDQYFAVTEFSETSTKYEMLLHIGLLQPRLTLSQPR